MRALLLSVLFVGSAHAAIPGLEARDLDGDGTPDAYYEAAQDLTWLGDLRASGRLMLFPEAQTWVDGLTLGGYDDWRLPHATYLTDPNCYLDQINPCGYVAAPEDSELAHLFSVTLQRDQAEPPQHPFQNWYRAIWTDAEPGLVFMGGRLIAHPHWDTNYRLAAWAVRDGDVQQQAFARAIASPAPEPSTYALMLLGLGLLAYRRIWPMPKPARM